MEYDTDKVDEAVFALPYLTLHPVDQFGGRAWRGHDWDALDRLHEKDFIVGRAATALALWPALGGHFVELWFLNWLRPRLPAARPVQVAARLVVWFVGGGALAVGMVLTAAARGTFRPARWPGWWHAWWLGGLAF